MPFVKGKIKTGGKKKGTPNQVTKDQRERAALIIDNNIDRMQGWIDKVAAENPERAYKMLLDMFEFSLPKLKAIELSGPGGKDLNPHITIRLIDTADQIPPEISET